MFTVLMFALQPNVFEAIIIFATVGGFVSFMVYGYLQNIEYYFYRNGGLTKKQLQVRTLIVNLVIAVFLFILLWAIKLL
jgi:uncharacterized membrane-anchored protein